MIFTLLTLFPFPWHFLYATNSFFDVSLITWLLYQFPQKHTNNVKKFCKFIFKSFRIINWFAYCIKCIRFPVICFAKFCNLALIPSSFYNTTFILSQKEFQGNKINQVLDSEIWYLYSNIFKINNYTRYKRIFNIALQGCLRQGCMFVS